MTNENEQIEQMRIDAETVQHHCCVNEETVRRDIENILAQRNGFMGKLDASKDKINECRRCLKIIGSECERVNKKLDKFSDDLIVRKIKDSSSYYSGKINELLRRAEDAVAEISKAKIHFARTDFCVAAAGQSQSGKSTTLQKIVGLEAIVEGGNGMSTTATRCIIKNISIADNSRAEITFFTENEFMEKVIRPYCAALRMENAGLIDISEYLQLETIDDFAAFDTTLFDRISQLGLSEKTKKYIARFLDLQSKYPDYKDLLGQENKRVTLEESDQYLVYPNARTHYHNRGAKCYAVKEGTLFCQYPHSVVEKIAFIDLPGAGEVAPDVEKRYAEGFDLSTDTILYVMRYDVGIYSMSHVEMIDGLRGIVPDGQLENYVIHFQNDFHNENDSIANKLNRVLEINRGRRTAATAVIGYGEDVKMYRLPADLRQLNEGDCGQYEVSDIGSDGWVVIFGKANDPEYVSRTLLPLICLFASKRLPQLDQELLHMVQKRVTELDGGVTDLITEINEFASSYVKRFPAPGDLLSIAVKKRVDELREAIWNIVQQINSDFKNSKLLTGTKTPDDILRELDSELRKEDSGLFLEKNRECVIQNLKNASSRMFGITGQLETYLRILRVTITERFAQLENSYDDAIANLQNRIFEQLKEAKIADKTIGVPFLSADEEKGMTLLDSWIESLDEAGCVGLKMIAEDFKKLEVNFYLTIYPDVMRAVFNESADAIVHNSFAIGNDGSSTAQSNYNILQRLAHEWAYDTKDCIKRRNAALQIIFCAANRFFERTLFADGSEDELHRFISVNLNRLTNNQETSADVCREVLHSLLDKLNKITEGK